jgi:hypothetical protein
MSENAAGSSVTVGSIPLTISQMSNGLLTYS